MDLAQVFDVGVVWAWACGVCRVVLWRGQGADDRTRSGLWRGVGVGKKQTMDLAQVFGVRGVCAWRVCVQCAKPTKYKPAHAQLSAAKHTQKRRRHKIF